MTTARRPQRLPARVYWFRRALVLSTALALVFAVARLVGGGAGDTGTAAPAADKVHPTPTANAGPLGPYPVTSTKTTGKKTGKKTGGKPGTAATATLAQPDGPCALDEITVTPVVDKPKAGGPVALALQLTGIQPACTFEVSAASLVAKITRGDDRVWSSQQCPASVPKTSVVVRNALATTVHLSWSGRRSDAKCTRATDWALPNSYRISAAVVGSEPGESVFHLVSPPRPVVTRTVQPTPKKPRTSTPTATANTGH